MSISLVRTRIGGRFRLKTRIGSGSFGEVYEAVDIIEMVDVAIKLERVDRTRSSLEHEVTVYKNLGRMVGIPRARWFGAEDGYDVLVLDLLGPSLASSPPGGEPVFGLQAALVFGNQMLAILERLHARDYIHRDIKPSNFLFGPEPLSQKVFLVDFGLAKQYRDPIQHLHIPYRDGLQLTGTALWASVNVHVGIAHSRRDDLESLAYVIIYLLRGYLPWQDLATDDIFHRKQSLSPALFATIFPSNSPHSSHTSVVSHSRETPTIFICTIFFKALPNEPLPSEGSGYGFGKKQAGVV
ncbi:kinase-like domain-containing protein [Fomitopsis serialis]|uniref:kinase-like domain-containing protein n=1 Tax=Fomitopsis serialis TaxID=139415 RepID=UPI0020080D84|nr:kinase-like domain-containing protein [Neoantrodia serialis]KAH9912269.1 kinase-like domain-containing protein [Neoantrodia serialis]